MDHMRHVDDFAAHHPELLDAWSAGCDARQLLAHSRGGGPAQSERRRPPRRLRTSTRSVPRSRPHLSAPPDRDDTDLRSQHRGRPAGGEGTWLAALVVRPLGGSPGGPGTHLESICDAHARLSLAARLVDTAEAFPMADGVVVDGPARGFEIPTIPMRVMQRRRLAFEETRPETCLGLRASATTTGRSSPRGRPSGSGCTGSRGTTSHSATRPLLFDSHLDTWLGFWVEALSTFYQTIREAMETHAGWPVRIAVGPRTSAAGAMARRCQWNPKLTVVNVCRVTRLLFGRSIPVVESWALPSPRSTTPRRWCRGSTPARPHTRVTPHGSPPRADHPSHPCGRRRALRVPPRGEPHRG